MAETYNQFICFFDKGLTGDEEEDRVPIAIGTTREEAMSIGLPRGIAALGEMGFHEIMYSGFIVIAQPQLSAEEFASVGRTIDDFFAKQAA